MKNNISLNLMAAVIASVCLSTCVVQQSQELAGDKPVWSAVSVGRSHVCGIYKPTGKPSALACWGSQKTVGGVPIVDSNKPIVPPWYQAQIRAKPTLVLANVVAADNSTCVRFSDGFSVCTLNTGSEFSPPNNILLRELFMGGIMVLGIDQNAGQTYSFPTTISSGQRVAARQREQWQSLAIHPQAQPIPVPDSPGILPLSAVASCNNAQYCLCGIDHNQKLSCAAVNNADSTPTDVNADARQRWKSVSLGDGFGCIIGVNELRLCCYGKNDGGQLGNNTNQSSDAPVFLAGEENGTKFADMKWRQVSTGTAHACAVRDDGQLYCWGSNSEGQLGDGTRDNRLAPVKVALPTTGSWQQVSAGNNATCAHTSNGELYCWGFGGNGQLGAGNPNSSTRPQLVGSP